MIISKNILLERKIERCEVCGWARFYGDLCRKCPRPGRNRYVSPPIRICKNCGKEYQRWQRGAKYCTQRCAGLWNWFDIGKPKRIEFYGIKNGKRVLLPFTLKEEE